MGAGGSTADAQGNQREGPNLITKELLFLYAASVMDGVEPGPNDARSSQTPARPARPATGRDGNLDSADPLGIRGLGAVGGNHGERV